jgi:alkane 1-monooxygenase
VTAAEGAVPTWRDPKRHLWVLGAVIPALPFAAWGLVEATGWRGLWWFGLIFVLGFVPAVDLLIGRESSNPPEELLEWLENDRYYRWVTYAFLPVQYASLVWGCWAITSMDGLGTLDRVGLAVTLGTVAGVAINTAHELGHKREHHERWFARIALAQPAYGHFVVEHNRGHHVRVATPEDPASARLGETVYGFWPRTVVGSLRNAWRLERVRLTRGGGRHLTLRNDVLAGWALSAVLWGGLLVAFGWGLLPYLLVQAAVGILLLETVNYLEHYGMLRQRVAPGGRYERVDPSHSWNSNHLVTNVLLYHLQRHSDHHAHPVRRYQALRDFPESPVLPTGYAGMILLALVPPLWRRVMDPRVVAHFGGDVARANLQPRSAARTLARYAVPAPAGEAGTGGGAPGEPAGRHTGGVAGSGGQGGGSVHACPVCGYTYDERRGEPREGFGPGTPWTRVPDDWCCPDCGVRDKVDFVAVRR